MLKKTSLATALLSLLLAAQAVDAQTAANDPNTTLSPVIVTATRTAITANDALSSVTVIDRKSVV